jgi:hypothetical protein
VPKLAGSGFRGDPDPQLLWSDTDLERLRRKHEAGDPFALYEAFIYCVTRCPNEPLPQWVAADLSEELRQKMQRKPGRRHLDRQSHEVRRKLQLLIRFETVSWLRKHKVKYDDVFDVAAEVLRIGAGTVRNGYNEFKRARCLKRGDPPPRGMENMEPSDFLYGPDRAHLYRVLADYRAHQ